MPHPIERLRTQHARLLKAYIAHVAWFTCSCVLAMTDAIQIGLKASILLTLVTVPPVLFYTAAVHKASRLIEPRAKTAGWGAILFFTLFLTPLESGLILPAKNLLVARRILRERDGRGRL